MIFDNQFLYGAHYHRPPNPPEEQHPFHLTRIKEELDFNIVKFRLQWNWIERKRGELYLDEVHKMFNLCDKLGLQVIAEISLENAPYWLEEQHPESRYVSATGHAIELGAYDATQAGGYPGLCFHHKVVQDEARRYLTQLIKEISHHPSLLAYDCWNEPHLEPVWQCNYWANTGDKLYCYCDESREAFRVWLQKKYKDIEELNKTWARAYTDFAQLNPPNRHGNYADWLDWMRFWFDALAEHMAYRYEIIKAADPSRDILSHSGAVPPFVPRANACIHNWKLAANVDAWGTSFAPKFFDWRLSEMAGVMGATHSAARGKPWWIAEMTGGCVYDRGFRNKMPYTRPKDVRSWNWLAVTSGAKGISYWCYLTESTGPEAGGFGLIPFNGEMSARAAEAGKQSKLLQSLHPVIKEYTPKHQVAVLYDPDNSTQLWAMENTDELYGNSFTGYTRAIFESDINARYLTYDTFDDIQEKVLIVPMCLSLRADVAEKIKKFVADGGILIADARMGLFDQRGFLQPVLPSFGLHEVAGLREEEAYCSNPDFKPNRTDRWPDDVYTGPMLQILDGQVVTSEYLVPLRLEGAESIGNYDGMSIAAHHTYGKGEVWYFGTYMGLSIYRGDKDALRIVKDLLARYTCPEVKGTVLRPRLITGAGRKLLVIFNDDPFAYHTDTIALPEGVTKAVSLFDGTEASVNDGCITLTLEGDDAQVYELM